MEEYKGTLEFTYYGRLMRIPYSINNLCGSPHINFEDKYGHSHGFNLRRQTGEWLYQCTVGPHWQADFLEVLYQMFDLAVERHGL